MSGPDSVPLACFKNGGQCVTSAIVDIARESLANGVFPGSLKDMWITTNYKGESRLSPANYRPLALTSHLAKIIERVVAAQLVEFLELLGLMDDTQHGARSGRSIITQLLQQHQRILKILEQGSNVEVLFLDFSKAFDLIDHSVLLSKLASLGVGGNLLRWIASYISGRRQRVRVDGKLSDWVTTTSGIAQGSVLGPLLFLIYIQDLGLMEGPSTGGDDSPEVIAHDLQVLILKFVDDTKVIAAVQSEDEVSRFQMYLNHLYKWSDGNHMRWNSLKFHLLRVGPHKQLVNDTLLFTPGVSYPLVPEDNIRNLGIMQDPDLQFSNQVHKAASKAT